MWKPGETLTVETMIEVLELGVRADAAEILTEFARQQREGYILCPLCGGTMRACEWHPNHHEGHHGCTGAGIPCPTCGPREEA